MKSSVHSILEIGIKIFSSDLPQLLKTKAKIRKALNNIGMPSIKISLHICSNCPETKFYNNNNNKNHNKGSTE